MGTVKAVKAGSADSVFTISPAAIELSGVSAGESISVSGVCLTVTSITPDSFTVDASHETLARTTLSSLKNGSRVNLEMALQAGGRMGGHIVNGHVDGVGTIRLDRPKMNALNQQVQEEIRAAAQEATERDDVRAVVVYGGERVFAAGADIKEMAEMSYADMGARSGGLQSSLTAVARIPKPVVAAVTGYALGGGCELALCADVRIAADNATLGQPEILLGIIPGAGGTQRL
ncbi:MAG: enoyl-CoA hydratase/isomerase family protein, partial [Candidatus Dadabacteria bacterium]|nr:enoyl-CoA hydratase/isomerase family protein [Candidatus Dadabacteria bacterium]